MSNPIVEIKDKLVKVSHLKLLYDLIMGQVPTKNSQLVNDSNYITYDELSKVSVYVDEAKYLRFTGFFLNAEVDEDDCLVVNSDLYKMDIDDDGYVVFVQS